MHATNGACFITWMQSLVCYVCCSFIYYASFFSTSQLHIYARKLSNKCFAPSLFVYLQMDFSCIFRITFFQCRIPFLYNMCASIFPFISLFITWDHPINVFYMVTTSLFFFNIPMPSDIHK